VPDATVTSSPVDAVTGVATRRAVAIVNAPTENDETNLTRFIFGNPRDKWKNAEPVLVQKNCFGDLGLLHG